MTQIIAGIMLALFVALMVFVGVVSFKKSKTMQGFLLGGRNVGAWMSAFAYGTSYFSAVIFIGYAGKTGWGIGIGGILIGVGNAILGSYLAWKFLAERTRSMTHRLNASTMPEFFSARYACPKMKVYSAIIIFVFLLPYSASVYMGLGYLFSAVFPGAPYTLCMGIIAALTAVYLVAGGYVATVVTDFIQGIIMIVGIFIMTFCLVNNPAVGGISEGLAKLQAIDPNLTNIFGGENWQSLLWLILLTSLGTWGLPQMIHKFYAVRDKQAVKKATIISTVFAGIIGAGAYFIGSLGRLFLDNTLPAEGFDKVVPDMLVRALSDGLFSSIVLSVVLLLVLSASMSTLSSVVLTSSSAITVDLLGHFMPNIRPKRQLMLTRLLCLVFIGLSFLVATMKVSFIISLMSFSWGTVAGCFLGPYVWGLYWKRTTKAGAWAGLLTGLVVMGGLVLFTTLTASFDAATANAPFFGVIAMFGSVIIVPIVSLLTKKPDAKLVSKVFDVTGEE